MTARGKRVPWRLLFGLLLLVCATVFASLNLERVSVSIGVYVFRDVPLFLALIVAYITGVACVLPFALVSKRPAGGKGEPAAAQGHMRDSAPHP